MTIVTPVAPAPRTVAAPKPAGDPSSARRSQPPGGAFRVVVRSIDQLVAVMPDWVKAVIAALAGLALAFGAGAALIGRKNRGIAHRHTRLADDLVALEAALVPDVPRRVGGLVTSVARRSDSGLAGRGRFYDVFALGAGRVGVVLGAVEPDGVDALREATFLRHTLRALLEAEPVPRRALQTADRVVGDDLEGTAVVAILDRRMGALTYACAGHAPPVVIGPSEHAPVLTATAPIGLGGRSGMRQTTVSFPAGSLACFGADDVVLRHERLMQAGAEAGPVTRVEELELTPGEVDAGAAADFIRRCGAGEFTVKRYDGLARRTLRRFGGADGVLVRVHMDADHTRVEVLLAGREWPYGPAPVALVG